jgi:hypothetical protein
MTHAGNRENECRACGVVGMIGLGMQLPSDAACAARVARL